MHSHKKKLTIFIRFTLVSTALLTILWFAYLFYAKATIETKIQTALERANQQLAKLTQFADFHYELHLKSIQQTLFYTDFEVTLHEIEHSKVGKSSNRAEEKGTKSNNNETDINETILIFKNHAIHGPFPFITEFNLLPALVNIKTQGFIPDSSTLDFIPIDLATDEPRYEDPKNNIEPILLGKTLVGLSGEFNSELNVPAFIASTKKESVQKHIQRHRSKGLTLNANAKKDFTDFYLKLSVRELVCEDSYHLIAGEPDSLINNPYQFSGLSATFMLRGIPKETLWDSDFSFILNIDKGDAQTNMPSSGDHEQNIVKESFNGINVDYQQNWQEKKFNNHLDLDFSGAGYYSDKVVFDISPLSIQFHNQGINKTFLDSLSNVIQSNISRKESTALAANPYRLDKMVSDSAETLASALDLLTSYQGRTNLSISAFTLDVKRAKDELANLESGDNKHSTSELDNVFLYSMEPINLVIDNLWPDSPSNIRFNLEDIKLAAHNINIFELKGLSLESTIAHQPLIPDIKWQAKVDELIINTNTQQNLLGIQNLDAQFNINLRDTLFNISKNIALDHFHFSGIDYGKWHSKFELLNLDKQSAANIADTLKKSIKQTVDDLKAGIGINQGFSNNFDSASIINIVNNLKTLITDQSILRITLKNAFSKDDENHIGVTLNFKTIDPLAIMAARQKRNSFDEISDSVLSKKAITADFNISNIALLYTLKTAQPNSPDNEINLQQNKIMQQIRDTVNQPAWKSLFDVTEDNLMTDITIEDGNVILNGNQISSPQFEEALRPLGNFLLKLSRQIR